MLVFRVAKQNRIRDLSGKGAEITGGRWNEKGVPVVYASSALSLCLCEILVHTDKDILPSDMYCAEIDIPDSLVSETPADLSAAQNTAAAGTAWLKTGSAAAVKVPSVILPLPDTHEFNVLINPRHAGSTNIKIKKVYPCPFDPRFFPRP
jgi:Uncharacterized conserved protein